MSTKAQKHRQSKSSGEESFQILNEILDKNEEKASLDFENINEKKIQEVQFLQNSEKIKVQLEREASKSQSNKNQKSAKEQLQMLKSQNQQQQMEIAILKDKNSQLQNKYRQLQDSSTFYYEEYEKIKKKFQQRLNENHKVFEVIQTSQLSPYKDFHKKKTENHSNSLTEEMNEKVKQCEFMIQSLKSTIQFYSEEDKKIREFLVRVLKFNPSFTMQLSTLVESAVIELSSNLKQLNREIQNIILGSHLNNYNKITTKRDKMEQQSYNHWQALSNLDSIKQCMNQFYQCK